MVEGPEPDRFRSRVADKRRVCRSANDWAAWGSRCRLVGMRSSVGWWAGVRVLRRELAANSILRSFEIGRRDLRDSNGWIHRGSVRPSIHPCDAACMIRARVAPSDSGDPTAVPRGQAILALELSIQRVLGARVKVGSHEHEQKVIHSSMKTSTPTRLALHWVPRCLAIVFAVFLSLFAMDSLQGTGPMGPRITGFLIHLAPSGLILGVLAIAWRWEWVGGVVFTFLGGFYLSAAWGRRRTPPRGSTARRGGLRSFDDQSLERAHPWSALAEKLTHGWIL